MMQKSTKKIAPIVCAAVVLAAVLLYVGAILFGASGETEIWAIVFVVLIGGSALAAIAIGILLALRQRLREIDGGEEEDAKVY